MAMQLVVEEQLTAAGVAPKSTVVPPAVVENPVPVIVTAVPPQGGPEAGEIPVTDGTGVGLGEPGGGDGLPPVFAVHWA
jgi:hypothetical protein